MDGVAMDPEATNAALRALRAAGTAFTESWSQANATISGLHGQLGQGQLGQAFMSAYQLSATDVASAADRGSMVPGTVADAGERYVAGVVSLDGQGRATIRSADGNGAP